MAINLKRDEMETIFSIMGDDRTQVLVRSDDPVLIRQINKIAVPYAVSATGLHEWLLPRKQLTLRKPRKPLSQEEKDRRKLFKALNKSTS